MQDIWRNIPALDGFVEGSAFPAQRGEATTRGIPTACAAPPLNEQIGQADLPPVSPDAQGEVRGVTLDPLHKAVPKAARRDPALYELLALIDALRDVLFSCATESSGVRIAEDSKMALRERAA